MRNRFKIDGVDFSALVNKYGYSVHYIPREGRLGGMMLDGSYTPDVLAWKAVVELPCNDLTADDLSNLLMACMKQEITVEFQDTKTGAPRTAVFIKADLSPQTMNLITPAGVRWYTGMVLSIEEK
ncbi:MAG: hypothetical protein IJ396_07730 [Oscillibacter sp.]|nr:hypothetical protein [Oscillibacter sp.]MBQ7778786.1 hypothetical protein [Oscillibacter sp.]